MKKAGDWICLPSLLFGYYPPEVVDLVKGSVGENITQEEFERHCEIVAKQKNIKPGKFLMKWIPRDKIELLETIQEHSEEPRWSTLWFEDEDFYIVNMPHDKLMSKIHNFMTTEPIYRESSSETVTYIPIPPTQEEIDEMGEEGE